MKFIDGGKFKRSDIDTNERISVIGRTGTGKSVFTDTMLNYLSKNTLVVLLDTKIEYDHIPALTMEVLTNSKRGLYRIYELEYYGELIDDLYYICEFLAENIFERGNAILVVEELGNVCKKGGRLYDQMPHTARLLQQGRAKECGFIGITQRPQEVHTTFLSQSDHIISFDVSSKHDREAMKSYVDKEKYELLGKHQFFHYSVKGGFLKRCYRLYEDELYHSLEYYGKIFGRA